MVTGERDIILKKLTIKSPLCLTKKSYHSSTFWATPIKFGIVSSQKLYI